MRPEQFRAALKTLGLSHQRAALLFLDSGNPRTVSRWVAGKSAIPRAIAILIALMLTGDKTVDQLHSLAPP
jgi:hypothetical protein